jgi:hypothetical protein
MMTGDLSQETGRNLWRKSDAADHISRQKYTTPTPEMTLVSDWAFGVNQRQELSDRYGKGKARRCVDGLNFFSPSIVTFSAGFHAAFSLK